jgi:hypothetical protein
LDLGLCLGRAIGHKDRNALMHIRGVGNIPRLASYAPYAIAKARRVIV